MDSPYTHAEILDALRLGRMRVVEFFGRVPDAAFFDGDPQRWSPAHHLGHLTLAHGRIALGFRNQSRLPKHATARSRRFPELMEHALASLAAAPGAFLRANPFTAAIDPGTPRASLIEQYEAADLELCAAAEPWSEDALDAMEMMHPILGPLTAREMLLFCLVHDRHHVRGVRRRLVAAGLIES